MSEKPVEARRDFRGVWRTRSGAVVWVQWWNAGMELWMGRFVDGSAATWNARGDHSNREFDLVSRLGEHAQRLKFGRVYEYEQVSS